jgi:hypothetical protein
MATQNKDFKVKHGIQVAENGVFEGTVSAATPTLSNHLATKEYVDSIASQTNVSQSSTPPETANDGDLYYDTNFGRIAIYFDSTWTYIATIADAEYLPDHIHDTSIDGNGLIVTRFYDAGLVTDASGDFVDAGTASTTTWETTWNGGTATDNFN